MTRLNLRFRPRLESLEDRWTPAGNVRTFFQGNNFIIQGDAEANEIIVSQPTAGTIKVASLDGTTTLNGRPDAVEEEIAGKNVIVRLLGGNDKVVINGNAEFEKNVRVDLGVGNNIFEAVGGEFQVGGNLDVAQAGTRGQTSTAAVNLAHQAGDTLKVLGNFSYTSTGAVNDTLRLGLGGSGSAVTGNLALNVGAGSNKANVRLDSVRRAVLNDRSEGVSIFETPQFEFAFALQSILGDLVASLGRANGEATVEVGTVGGNLTVKNHPASTGDVTVDLDVGTSVSGAVTVNLTGEDVKFLDGLGDVGQNVVVNVSAQKTAEVSVTAGDIGGAANVTVKQPSQAEAAVARIIAALTADFVKRNTTVSASGPGETGVTVNVPQVGQNLSVLTRGTSGATTVTTTNVGGAATLRTTGTNTMANLGDVSRTATVTINVANQANVSATKFNGSAVISTAEVATVLVNIQQAVQNVAVTLGAPATSTISVADADKNMNVVVKGGANSTVNVDNSSVDGNLNLTQTGNVSQVFVNNVSVARDLIQRGLGKFVATLLTGGSVGGTASFTGGNILNGFHSVSIDDATLARLRYMGGRGSNFLDLDTDPAKPGETRIQGDALINLGGGDDEVKLGGKTGEPAVPDPNQHVAFLGKVTIIGGRGNNDTLTLNNGSFNFNTFKQTGFETIN